MDCRAERFAAAAEAMVGAPFRLHGRDAVTGVDCVGLIVLALEQTGVRVPPLPPYALRNIDYAFLPELAAACGFSSVSSQPRRGDCIVTAPGPAQRHLHIATAPDCLVHAHAGLCRVVRMPWQHDAHITHHWRFVPLQEH